jgi:hypothetical protein
MKMEAVVHDCSRKELSSEERRGRVVVIVIRDWRAREERCQSGKGWRLMWWVGCMGHQ